jgi:hypothetical protein
MVSGLYEGGDPLVFIMEHEDNVIYDPFGNGRIEFSSPGYGVVVVETYVDRDQNASISHEDDLRGSEIEKEGGSEG